MNALDRSATLRDVLQARYYVTRTVIQMAELIYGLLGICAAVGAKFYIAAEPDTPAWHGTVALVVVLIATYYSRPHVSKEFTRAEEACNS